jgi:DNA mismatch repair protein MSH2
MADDALHGNFTLNHFNLSNHMRLDYSAMQALNLIPAQENLGKNSNLFDLLNHCKTAMGSRMLMK